MCAWNIWCENSRVTRSSIANYRKVLVNDMDDFFVCIINSVFHFGFHSCESWYFSKKRYASLWEGTKTHNRCQTDINWNLSVKKSETRFLKTCKFRFYCRRFQGVSCLSAIPLNIILLRWTIFIHFDLWHINIGIDFVFEYHARFSCYTFFLVVHIYPIIILCPLYIQTNPELDWNDKVINGHNLNK